MDKFREHLRSQRKNLPVRLKGSVQPSPGAEVILRLTQLNLNQKCGINRVHADPRCRLEVQPGQPTV